MKPDDNKVNVTDGIIEDIYVMSDEAGCSPEFPEGCVFAEKEFK